MPNEQQNGSVKERLLQTGLKLFSEYGYEATSTRMIAKEANVVRSSIAFYFETKEALYEAVIGRAVEVVNHFLDPLYQEATAALAAGAMDAETAGGLIDRILSLQVDWYFNSRYSDIKRLILREDSKFYGSSFDELLYEKVIGLLARLIEVAAGSMNHHEAVMMALMINGSVQSMGEHYVFTSKTFELNQAPEQLKCFQQQLCRRAVNYAHLILDDARRSVAADASCTSEA